MYFIFVDKLYFYMEDSTKIDKSSKEVRGLHG